MRYYVQDSLAEVYRSEKFKSDLVTARSTLIRDFNSITVSAGWERKYWENAVALVNPATNTRIKLHLDNKVEIEFSANGKVKSQVIKHPNRKLAIRNIQQASTIFLTN